MNDDTTETMRPPCPPQSALEDHRIERAMLFARRQAFRDVLAMVQRLQSAPDWSAGFSVFRDWAEHRERVISRALEQARTDDGRVPEQLREAPIDADARAMVEAMQGVGHSVVVEHEGKRAVFTVTGWSKDIHTLHLEPQVDP